MAKPPWSAETAPDTRATALGPTVGAARHRPRAVEAEGPARRNCVPPEAAYVRIAAYRERER